MLNHFYILYNLSRNVHNTLERELDEFFTPFRSKVIEVAIIDDFIKYLEKAVSDMNINNPRCKKYSSQYYPNNENGTTAYFYVSQGTGGALITISFHLVNGSIDLSIDFRNKTKPSAAFICNKPYTLMGE